MTATRLATTRLGATGLEITRVGLGARAIAVAWVLRSPEVDGAIVGYRGLDQVDPILPAATLELTQEDTAELEGGAR
jgi:aryl-alcohol dehydrogenase-like predicted oxidoreductase